MYRSHVIGKNGEEEVEKYLINKGYEIIEKNFSCKLGEIDIIAKDKEELVIIEVKTRTSNKYGAPAEAVGKTKQHHILKTSQYYLMKNRLENVYVRLDVIEVYVKNEQYIINHIKQAFE